MANIIQRMLGGGKERATGQVVTVLETEPETDPELLAMSFEMRELGPLLDGIWGLFPHQGWLCAPPAEQQPSESTVNPKP